jgi:hypothetical protein
VPCARCDVTCAAALQTQTCRTWTSRRSAINRSSSASHA